MKIASVLMTLLSTVKAAYDLDYFDRLRTAPLLTTSAIKSPANEDRMWEVTTTEGETFSLAHITAFLPFSDGTSIREAVEDDLAATLMAIHHFNNPELSPHLTPEDLADCNIKLTAEFQDTRQSPIDSTRRFTNILQRQNVLSEPLPAGVIGAYRSAVTSPLAILTGVNDIPQISYASSSTDFDVKEQYPLFGRTIHSSTGQALVALELFQSLGASHVGVLFVTDAFGSALQKAFQDTASEAGVVTDSVAFSYSADLEGREIPKAVESLKKTQFKLFYVIAFEVHYESIMEAAYEQGLIGDDYLWIFDGFDSATFHRNAVYPPGMSLCCFYFIYYFHLVANLTSPLLLLSFQVLLLLRPPLESASSTWKVDCVLKFSSLALRPCLLWLIIQKRRMRSFVLRGVLPLNLLTLRSMHALACQQSLRASMDTIQTTRLDWKLSPTLRSSTTPLPVSAWPTAVLQTERPTNLLTEKPSLLSLPGRTLMVPLGVSRSFLTLELVITPPSSLLA
jgi:hypothetical protein